VTDVFALTTRPAEALFFRKGDPNDPRLGELVSRDPADFTRSRVVIVGCPQDLGVARNGGRVGASEAPAEIRRMFYRLTPLGLGLPPGQVFDLGDLIVPETLEACAARQRELVAALVRGGRRVIVLGGGNDIAWPDAAGLADVLPDPTAINIDAHFDVRADQPMNSGTPYRQLIASGAVRGSALYELGYQPQVNAAGYLAWLAQQGAHAIDLEAWRAGGLLATFERVLVHPARAVFVGFDMDAVRGADAPGVSAVNPLGLTADEFVALWSRVGAEPRARVVDLSEVNPRHDVDGRTARLAAVSLHAFLRAFRD